jgi:phage-related tail fiber protein
MSIRKGRLTSQGLTAAPVNFPPGTLIDFAGATAPQGWLLCDGSAISRTEYAALFAAIGTAHGVGDGSTTFNLPDLRGEFRRGLDNMGTPAGARGKDVDGTGRSVGQGQGHNFGSHRHRVLGGSSGDLVGGLTQTSRDSFAGFNTTGTPGYISQAADTSGGHLIETTGGSETRPTNVAFPVAIKY